MPLLSKVSFDLAIVGAGICGLAHALAAVRVGKRVVVIDREARANGASIRNFGFITVTGQQRGDFWRRAMRSRDVWVEVAQDAGIPVVQRGLAMVARRPQARRVIEAFLETEMGEDCRLLEPAEARKRLPMLADAAPFSAVLTSPHDVRVESVQAIPRLAERHGVAFVRQTSVVDVAPPRIETSRGTFMPRRPSSAPATISRRCFRSAWPDMG